MAETKAGRSRRTSGAAPNVEEVPPPAAASTGAQDLVCTVAFCPLCAAVTAARGAAPDAIDHLLNAARELFLAARAVMDVRADDLEGGGRSSPARLERIDIG